jgi:hypothetical protein
LVPLAERLPNYQHPELGVSNRDLLVDWKDPLAVRMYADG